MVLKFSVKSGKDGTGTLPTGTLFGHIGDEISENRKRKRTLGLNGA
jgi:hypothetical protein